MPKRKRRKTETEYGGIADTGQMLLKLMKLMKLAEEENKAGDGDGKREGHGR